MSYLAAASKADDAARHAKRAKGVAEDQGVEHLADAVAKLSEAVAELARSIHRDN